MKPQSSRHAQRLMTRVALVGLAPLMMLIAAQRYVMVPAPLDSIIGLLTLATLAVEAYIGVWFIILNQRELHTKHSSLISGDIDFSSLAEISIAQKNPLAVLYLALTTFGVVLLLIAPMISSQTSTGGIVALCILAGMLVTGGSAGLVLTGYARLEPSHAKNIQKFAEQNNFAYRKGSMHNSIVVNGLASMFPGRMTKISFELKGKAYDTEFNLVSFQLYGGKSPSVIEVVTKDALVDDIYGLLILDKNAINNSQLTTTVPVISTTLMGNKAYILIADGIPKDKHGLAAIFSLINAKHRSIDTALNDDQRLQKTSF